MNTPLLAASQGVPGDSLRAALDSVFAAETYRWAERSDPLATLSRWWNQVERWLGGLATAHPQAYRILLWGLVAILVAIVVHAVWVMVGVLRSAQAPAEFDGSTVREARGAAYYRREANRLAMAGRYPEAMQAEFLALVLDLEARSVLRFHPSKTPYEYAAEARLPHSAYAAFQTLVRSLYGYAFAGRACGPVEFGAWRAEAAPERYADAH